MNWYKRHLYAQDMASYLQSIGASSDIIQYITSQEQQFAQILTNEFRKNPVLTIEQLKTIIPPPRQPSILLYTSTEQNRANIYNGISQWLLTSFRKLRKGKLPNNKTPNGLADILTSEEHRFYWVFDNKISEIYDWWRNMHPDIASYSPEQAIAASDEWHQMMAGKGEGKEYTPTQPNLIIYGPQWQNTEWEGWTIQKVVGENDLLAEGNKMNHCVGSYCEDVENEYSVIYSLRDPQNNPHVTIEVNGEKGYNTGSIRQMQGNSNQEPKPEYRPMIKEWIEVNGEQSGINREINTFEVAEEEGTLSVMETNEAMEKILQGENNEYGLKYVLDESLSTIMGTLLVVVSQYGRHNQCADSDIGESPSYLVNLALMHDLNLPHLPRHAGEWAELRKAPGESEWDNIQILESEAFKIIDEITEDLHMSDTGIEYPLEEDYDNPEEYKAAMEQYYKNESEVHREWVQESVSGRFATGLLDDINSFRKSDLIPSAQELYDRKQKKQKEQERVRSVAKMDRGNWYKRAQQEDCKGWTAVRMDKSLSTKIQQWGKDNIPDFELSGGGDRGDGRETDTHITMLYGICTKNREIVKELLDGEKPVRATLGKIGCFVNNDDFDVVIVKVDSPDLERLHKKIADELRVEETHGEYKPHCTVAYVKKGEARKHTGNTIFTGTEIIFSEVAFKDGVTEKETIISLGD